MPIVIRSKAEIDAGTDGIVKSCERTLRVTADDLGLTPGVTDGIFQAFQDGIVTHASLMANGLDFPRAAAMARGLGLGTGVHLTLTWGRPLCPPKEIAGLVATDGRFLGLKILIRRAMFGGLNANEIAREWAIQIEHAIEAGIRPTHLDSHHHVHLLPQCFAAAKELAARYQIPYVRRPMERGFLTGTRRLAKRWVFRWLCRRPWPAATSDSFFGLELQGHPSYARMLQKTIRNLPVGHAELMVHPGRVDDVLAREDRLVETRQTELTALCDPALRILLAECGIQLDRPAEA